MKKLTTTLLTSVLACAYYSAFAAPFIALECSITGGASTKGGSVYLQPGNTLLASYKPGGSSTYTNTYLDPNDTGLLTIQTKSAKILGKIALIHGSDDKGVVHYQLSASTHAGTCNNAMKGNFFFHLNLPNNATALCSVFGIIPFPNYPAVYCY
jgi:hypothetical protein